MSAAAAAGFIIYGGRLYELLRAFPVEVRVGCAHAVESHVFGQPKPGDLGCLNSFCTLPPCPVHCLTLFFPLHIRHRVRTISLPSFAVSRAAKKIERGARYALRGAYHVFDNLPHVAQTSLALLFAFSGWGRDRCLLSLLFCARVSGGLELCFFRWARTGCSIAPVPEWGEHPWTVAMTSL